MKTNSYLLVILLLSLACGQSGTNSQKEHGSHAGSVDASAKDTEAKPASPHMTAMAFIDNTHIHIEYSAPSVRGRTIWNGLVAYDKVWVTGAHNATSINFSHDVKVANQRIPYGTYGFFTIPGRDEWTLILNENYEQHLADDYDQDLDVMRVKVKPEILEQPVETLLYEVIPGENGKGTIAVSWEKIKVSLPIEVIK